MLLTNEKRTRHVGDGLPNEVLNNETVINILFRLINMCFNNNLIPRLRTKSTIKPILKKSTKDPCVPLNNRGISLLSCVSKVLSGGLNNRLYNIIMTYTSW